MTENSVKSAHLVMQSALVVGAYPIIDLFLQPPDKYRKVASSRLSRLVAHQSIFRMFMKGKFDAHVL